MVNFDFMEPPDRVRLVKSLRLLFLIGALDADGKLTALGAPVGAPAGSQGIPALERSESKSPKGLTLFLNHSMVGGQVELSGPKIVPSVVLGDSDNGCISLSSMLMLGGGCSDTSR